MEGGIDAQHDFAGIGLLRLLARLGASLDIIVDGFVEYLDKSLAIFGMK